MMAKDCATNSTSPLTQGPHDLVRAIERLMQLDEQETMRQRERASLLSLIGAIIEALPDALIVTDTRGKIVLINEKAEFMFGYSRSELIGQPLEMLMPERLRERHIIQRDIYNQFHVSPRPQTMGLGMQLAALHSDGREFPTDIMLARLVVPKGIFNLALIRYSPEVHASILPPIARPEREKASDIPDARS
jgi:PAS domain S-box-containing protein